jgi:hypothetical protein
MVLASLLLFFLSPVWVALSLPLTLAVAADGQKGGDGPCSPVLCGNVSISFPFEVVPEKAAEMKCGLDGFQVACNKNTPYLGYYKGIFSLQILNIFYSNSSLIIVDDHKLHDFSVSGGSGCHVPIYNSSYKLDYPFSISPASKNLIFYNCVKAPAMAVRGKLVETICRNNTFVRVAEHFEESGTYGDYFLEGCNATVMPVLGGSGKTNASRYEELINDGFLLTWELPSVRPQPPPKQSKFTPRANKSV